MTKLNLLLVEDNDTDALLVVRQLKKEGFEVAHIQVKTRQEMEQALSTGEWDIVISDYSLPGFGGQDALEIFKSRHLDIPFILVSGTVGEDIAVSIMKGGANDYLMKTHLNRLGPAVKRELEETVLKREKRRIETMLSQTEKRFQRLIQDLIDVVWLSDQRGQKLFIINAAFEKLFGNVPVEIKLEPCRWEEMVMQEDLEHFREFTNSLQDKGIAALEYRITRSDGNIRWVYDQRYLVQDGEEGEAMVGGILSDITEKKIAEQELVQAKRAAEESSRLKSTLLQNMSHEFRTPMNGILGFSEILMAQISDPNSLSMIGHISTSGQRLQRTLDAIMLFAQLEGGMVLKPTLFDAGEIMKHVCDQLSPSALEKGLTMNLIISAPLMVFSDRKLLEITIRNIIENAVKFTPNGFVEIAGTLKHDGQEVVEISIRDTGIGIAPEKQSVIFEEFRQAYEGYDRPYEGSGLGLSIARKCINLLQGTLSLRSEPQEGTTFIIDLPVSEVAKKDIPGHDQKTTAPVPEGFPQQEPASPKVLLVEDNDSNIELVRLYLNREFNLDVARDGLTALDMVNNDQYDAILMDINLGPGPDGIDTIEGVRKVSGYDSTPIIAVTGYTFRNEKDFITSKGADHYLGKPFNKKSLVNLLKQVTMQKL